MPEPAAEAVSASWDRMPRYVRAGLRWGTAALVLSGYLALVSEPSYGPAALLPPLAVVLLTPICRRAERSWKPYRVVRTFLTGLFIVSLPFLYAELGLLDTVATVVAYVQCYTLLHRMRVSDYAVAYLMAFFLLLIAVSGSPDATVALAMALFLVASVWCFLSLQLYRELERLGAAPVVDADAAYRGEISDRFFHPWGRMPGVLFRTAIGMAVVCGALTVVFFGTMPRLEAGVLGRADVPAAVTGLSAAVPLSGGQQITEDAGLAFRVEFPEEPGKRYEAPMFWRVNVLNYYDKNTWIDMEGTDKIRDDAWDLSFRAFQGRLTVVGMKRDSHPVVQDIFLEDAATDKVPLLYRPFQIEASEGALAWNAARNFTVIRVGRRNATGLQYQVWSSVENPSAEQLRAIRVDYRKVFSRRDYFILTHAPVQERTKALAQQLTQDQDSVYDKVMAIQRYLEGSEFSYSLSIPPLDARSPLDSFIHDVRTGHCELFASAMAMMARSVGIPARVAQGYRGGEWNETDQAYWVRQSMAHLWVEIFFPWHGWVAFDPSPGTAYSTVVSNTISRSFFRYVAQAKLLWYRNVIGYRGQVTVGGLMRGIPFWNREPRVRNVEHGTVTETLPVPAQTGRSLGKLWLALIGTGGAAVFWWGIRRARSSGKGRGTVDQIRAVRLYRELTRALQGRGIACGGKSAGEVLTAVGMCGWDDADAVHRIVGEYNRARFGTRPLPMERFRELRDVVRALSERRR